jgi:hypothetical protein
MIDFIELEPIENVFYFINQSTIQNLNYYNIAITNENKILKYSNDWLYLIGNQNITTLNCITDFITTNKNNSITIQEHVIPFITSFKTSVHAYCGIYSIILNYVNNIDKYKNIKIIIYKNLQKGIYDFIYFLCDIGIINYNIIIILEPDIIYHFDYITIIPNILHSYFESIDIRDKIFKFIEDNVISNICLNKNEKYMIHCYDRISIFKYTTDHVITSNLGAIDFDIAQNISNNNNCKILKLEEYNEIQIIQLFYNAKFIIISWGTTFMKNFIYLSNKCENVIVLIIGPEFIREYHHLVSNNKLVYKYKNAIFNYQIL